MDTKLPTAQEAAIGFARRLRQQDLAEVIDFDSRVVVLQNFTNSAQRSRAGDPAHVSRRLDLALQRRLHRAQGPEEGRREERRGNPAPGHRRALGRRGHVEPAAVRRGARPREAFGDRHLHDRPARERLDEQRLEAVPGSRVRAAAARRRRRAAARSSRTRWPTSSGVYGQISDELSSQYTVGYTSKNNRRDGAWRRVVVRVNRPSTIARTKQGYFGPTSR